LVYMNDFLEFSETALNEALGVFADRIQYGGKSISCVASSITFEEEFELGGIMAKTGLQVTLPLNEVRLLTIAIGQYLTYKGNRFKVIEIADDDISLTLTCVTDKK